MDPFKSPSACNLADIDGQEGQDHYRSYRKASDESSRSSLVSSDVLEVEEDESCTAEKTGSDQCSPEHHPSHLESTDAQSFSDRRLDAIYSEMEQRLDFLEEAIAIAELGFLGRSPRRVETQTEPTRILHRSHHLEGHTSTMLNRASTDLTDRTDDGDINHSSHSPHPSARRHLHHRFDATSPKIPKMNSMDNIRNSGRTVGPAPMACDDRVLNSFLLQRGQGTELSLPDGRLEFSLLDEIMIEKAEEESRLRELEVRATKLASELAQERQVEQSLKTLHLRKSLQHRQRLPSIREAMVQLRERVQRIADGLLRSETNLKILRPQRSLLLNSGRLLQTQLELSLDCLRIAQAEGSRRLSVIEEVKKQVRHLKQVSSIMKGMKVRLRTILKAILKANTSEFRRLSGKERRLAAFIRRTEERIAEEKKAAYLERLRQRALKRTERTRKRERAAAEVRLARKRREAGRRAAKVRFLARKRREAVQRAAKVRFLARQRREAAQRLRKAQLARQRKDMLEAARQRRLRDETERILHQSHSEDVSDPDESEGGDYEVFDDSDIEIFVDSDSDEPETHFQEGEALSDVVPSAESSKSTLLSMERDSRRIWKRRENEQQVAADSDSSSFNSILMCTDVAMLAETRECVPTPDEPVSDCSLVVSSTTSTGPNSKGSASESSASGLSDALASFDRGEEIERIDRREFLRRVRASCDFIPDSVSDETLFSMIKKHVKGEGGMKTAMKSVMELGVAGLGALGIVLSSPVISVISSALLVPIQIFVTVKSLISSIKALSRASQFSGGIDDDIHFFNAELKKIASRAQELEDLFEQNHGQLPLEIFIDRAKSLLTDCTKICYELEDLPLRINKVIQDLKRDKKKRIRKAVVGGFLSLAIIGGSVAFTFATLGGGTPTTIVACAGGGAAAVTSIASLANVAINVKKAKDLVRRVEAKRKQVKHLIEAAQQVEVKLLRLQSRSMDAQSLERSRQIEALESQLEEERLARESLERAYKKL